MIDLLRRAWDTLDTFKQAYPENWDKQDEQVLNDLLKADLKLSGVELKWQGLTDEEQQELYDAWIKIGDGWGSFYALIEAKLKEKNT